MERKEHSRKSLITPGFYKNPHVEELTRALEKDGIFYEANADLTIDDIDYVVRMVEKLRREHDMEEQPLTNYHEALKEIG